MKDKKDDRISFLFTIVGTQAILITILFALSLPGLVDQLKSGDMDIWTSRLIVTAFFASGGITVFYGIRFGVIDAVKRIRSHG